MLSSSSHSFLPSSPILLNPGYCSLANVSIIPFLQRLPFVSPHFIPHFRSQLLLRNLSFSSYIFHAGYHLFPHLPITIFCTDQRSSHYISLVSLDFGSRLSPPISLIFSLPYLSLVPPHIAHLLKTRLPLVSSHLAHIFSILLLARSFPPTLNFKLQLPLAPHISLIFINTSFCSFPRTSPILFNRGSRSFAPLILLILL